MSVTQKNTYVIGSNNDLTNALLNIDLNRIGGDLTYLENDGGTLKVSVGSLIEANGSIYAVEGSAETPSGTAEDGAYLFFDPSSESFVWSTTAGTYDAALGGIYDASDRRQCRFRLRSATAWDSILSPETVVEGIRDQGVNGDTLRWKVIDIGDWNMDATSGVAIAHGLDASKIRSLSVLIRNDAGTRYYLPTDTYGISSDPLDLRWGELGGPFYSYDTTTVKIFRLTTGFFDNADFNSTGYNRGWVTIGYVE
jgi:hypothetical protein